MKFYVHSEDLDVTMVIQWDPGNVASIQSVIQLFLDNLSNKFPEQYSKIEKSTVKICKGSKPLIDTDQVIKRVSNLDDLYVYWQQKETSTATNSGQTAAKPGQTATKPDQTATKPGQTATPPDQTATKPGQTATKPGQTATNSGRTATKPGQTATNSGQTATKPSQTATDSGNGTVSSPEESYGIDFLLSLAESLCQKQQLREALLLYEDVLKRDSSNKTAFNGIIDIYLRAGRANDALKYAEKAKKHFDASYRLGQCYVKLGEPDQAIKTLFKYCKDMRSNGGMDITHSHEVQVLLAKAYLQKDQTDMAIVVLQGILRANQQCFDALVEYAPLIYQLGPEQRKEAMSVMLSALVKKTDDSYVKDKFASLCVQQHGLQVLQSVSGPAWNEVPALVFMATTLRESGAVKEAIKLMEHALSVQPGNAHTLLTYVHMLELIEEHTKGVVLIKEFIQQWPEKSIGDFKCGMLQPLLQQFTGDIYLNVPSKIVESTCAINPVTALYDDDARYLLALLFTLVKILYVKGALLYIPAITKLLDPLTEHQNLHETNVRNEAAYYFCVSQIMKTKDTTKTQPSSSQPYIYFVGDSHCITPAWHTIHIKGEDMMIHPVLSTGTKIWHLRDKSTFYPKINFQSATRNIPVGANVVFCFGEIDCREALLFCVEKAKYDSLEEAIDTVISIYIDLMLKLKKEKDWNIYVHPVMPVLDLTRPVVLQFNKQLSQRLNKVTQLRWLDFTNDLLIEINGEMKLRPTYEFDGTHAHPSYVSLLAEMLEKNWL